MSLILEALKKSEAQRQLGQAPGLGTPITATRRRRSVLPWIVVLVVAIGVIGGWWVLHQPRAPQSAGGAAQPAKPPGSANMTVMPAPGADGRAATDRRAAAAPGAAHAPTAAQTLASAAPPGIANRTPQTAAPLGPPSQASRVPPDSIPTPAPATTTTPAASAAPAAAAAPPPAPAMSTPVATAPSTTAVAPPAAAPVSAPAFADVQSIDDLPYNIRKDLPDLPISMQVYSADAARRFIIVNGIRKVEGDTIKDAVMLHEIRPNGVVLEFHGQRFFMPRPGA